MCLPFLQKKRPLPRRVLAECPEGILAGVSLNCYCGDARNELAMWFGRIAMSLEDANDRGNPTVTLPDGLPPALDFAVDMLHFLLTYKVSGCYTFSFLELELHGDGNTAAAALEALTASLRKQMERQGATLFPEWLRERSSLLQAGEDQEWLEYAITRLEESLAEQAEEVGALLEQSKTYRDAIVISYEAAKAM